MDLRDYLGTGTTPGANLAIWLRKWFLSPAIGLGKVLAVDGQTLKFRGQIKAIVYNGEIDLAIGLDGAGGATVQINGAAASSASYAVGDGQLTIQAMFPKGQEQTIALQRGGDGGRETWLALKGAYSYNIYLVPA